MKHSEFLFAMMCAAMLVACGGEESRFEKKESAQTEPVQGEVEAVKLYPMGGGATYGGHANSESNSSSMSEANAEDGEASSDNEVIIEIINDVDVIVTVIVESDDDCCGECCACDESVTDEGVFDPYDHPDLDLEPDGYTIRDGDCDPMDGSVHPGAFEFCDGRDNDCNGVADEPYLDALGDACHTYDETGACVRGGVMVCNASAESFNALTCSARLDGLPWTWTQTQEAWCDGIDNDCDGRVDTWNVEPDLEEWSSHTEDVRMVSRDTDGDGWGINGGTDNLWVCNNGTKNPDGYVGKSVDCDDSNPNVHPGAEEICDDGVDNNCDGAMGICSPLVSIDLGGLPAGEFDIAKGAREVVMLSFRMKEMDGSDAWSSGTAYQAMKLHVIGDDDGSFYDDVTGEPSVDNDVPVHEHVSACSLVREETGDILVGPVAVPPGGYTVFDHAFGLLPAAMLVQVQCEFTSVSPQNGDPDAFAVVLENAWGISFTNRDGDIVPTEYIRVTGLHGHPNLNLDGEHVSVLVHERGDLILEKSAGTPKSGIVLGATARAFVSEYMLRGKVENFTVDTLPVANCVTWNTIGGCALWGADRAVTSVYLRYAAEDGSVIETAPAVLVDGGAVFTDLAITIPAYETRMVKVYVDTQDVGPTLAASGDQFSIGIDHRPGTILAYGDTSGELVDTAVVIGDPRASIMTLRKSKPTISLASGSPMGAGIPGFSETIRLDVCADARDEIGIRHLLFDVTATDNANSGWNDCAWLGQRSKWEVYDRDDPSTDLLETEIGGTCDSSDTLRSVTLVLDSLNVAAGTCKTLSVETNTTGASSAADDSFRLTLTSVVWDDGEEASEIAGKTLQNLPVIGGTSTY